MSEQRFSVAGWCPRSETRDSWGLVGDPEQRYGKRRPAGPVSEIVLPPSVGMRSYRVPSPAPDELREQIHERKVPKPGELPPAGRQKHPATLELFALEKAADFSDPALVHPHLTLRELQAQAIATDVLRRVYERRATRRQLAARHPGGLKPLPGSEVLLFLDYVDRGFTSPYEYARQLDSLTVMLCGYERIPSPQYVDAAFAELEKDVEAFLEVAALLIRLADSCCPGLFDICFLDATIARSPSRRKHICTDKHIQKGRCKRNLGPTRPHGLDQINQARWDEVDDPDWGEQHFLSGERRTRLPFIQVTQRPGRPDRMHGLYAAGGCYFASLDWQAGMRSYQGTTTSWFGYLVSWLVPAALGEPAFCHVYPADVQEYDVFPTLLDLFLRALGRYPRIISTDSAYSIKAFAEACTRRRITFVTPDRRGKIKPTALVDQHNVPRCQGCGGPGIVTAPGFGLHPSGVFITYLCASPVPGRDECLGEQTLSCATEWRRVTALPRTTELYQAISKRHGVNERVGRHNRQRFKIAGKELPEILARPGLGAQRLRIAAAMLLLWFRLCLRNGWLTPLIAPVDAQKPSRIRLSGRQDRFSGEIRSAGIGTPGLQKVYRERQRLGLSYPSGRAWEECASAILARAGLTSP